MRQRMKQICSIVTGLLLSGCGVSTSLSIKEMLHIAMVGAFEAPSDATGTTEPRFETFTLNKITLTDSDGNAVPAYADAAKAFRVVSRPQIICDFDLSSYVGKTFTNVAVEFDSTITVGGKYSSAMTTTLANPTPSYTESFTVEKAKSVRLDVYAQWRNTLTRDDTAKAESVSSPEFSMAVEAQ